MSLSLEIATSRKIAFDAFYNYASTAICGSAGLLLIFIIGAHYGPAVLGVFNIVFAFYIILSQVAAFGVHHSVLKHVAENVHDHQSRKEILISGLSVTLPLAIVVSICLMVSSNLIGNIMDSTQVGTGLVYAAVGLFFFALNKVFLAALNALSRLKEYAVYMALRYILMVGTLVVLATAKRNTPPVVILPIAEIVLFFLLCGSLSREMKWVSLAAQRSWSITHLHFGFRGFGGNLLLDLNTRVDVLCLGLFTSDRTVGIYSMAAILAEAAYQLPLVMRTVYNPTVIRMLSAHTYSRLQNLVRKTRLKIWSAMVFVLILVTLIYPLVIPFLTNDQTYAQGQLLFAIIMTGVVIASGYVPFGSLLINAGRPGLQTFMIVLLIMLNACGNLILIPIIDSAGAAIATAATHIFSLYLLKLFSFKYLKLRI